MMTTNSTNSTNMTPTPRVVARYQTAATRKTRSTAALVTMTDIDPPVSPALTRRRERNQSERNIPAAARIARP